MNLIVQKTQNIFKTAIDYFISLSCMIILTPVFVILAISIKITGKGPVIFSQKRIGLSGRPFYIYKFRSMRYETEDEITLPSDNRDKRMTILGRFMRKYKFDEIPNFINVLKGDMSLVGPRPEQPFYIDQIMKREPMYKHLQIIKPGITSWGQIKYGYASNVDEMIKRFKYDLFYLENRSLWFDLKIALNTIAVILKGKGI